AEYTKKLETAEKERDELKLTLEKLQNSSKSLNNLLDSQVSDKSKPGLGYKDITPEIFVNSSEILEKQENRSDKGYQEVPLPLIGNYMPPKRDLRLIDEHFESEYVDVSTVSSSDVKTVDMNTNGVFSTKEPRSVIKNSFGLPIIKDWHSDDESEEEISPTAKVKTVKPSVEKIESVTTAKETVKTEESHKPHKHYPRGNQKNWNNLMVNNSTARDRAVVSGNMGREVNAVKALACWVWNAKNNSVSNTFKKYSYIDARGRSKPFASTNAFEEHSFERFSPFKYAFSLPHVPIVTPIDDNGIFGNAYDDDVLEEEVDMNNVDSSYTIPEATKFLKDHPQEQMIGSLETHVQTRHMSKTMVNLDCFPQFTSLGEPIIKTFKIVCLHVFLSQMEPKKPVQALQDPSWVEAMQDELLQFKLLKVQIDKTLFIKRHKDDILVVQLYVDDIIFGSTKKELSTEFEKLMHDKFQMSSMGELSFFLGLQVKQKSDGVFISQDKYVVEILKKFNFVTMKTASTPMESNKTLIKDEESKDVDVHLYRLMIGSLMYLTSSRPDITFAVCLWYPKDSPFDLEAYSDSDYAGVSLDRKSTTEGCQFFGKRLISWQCKKRTIVSNSTTEAEYVAAANCCGQIDDSKGWEMLCGYI
nr:putative ribonuclease H-like domain-containing protein [Tanacetum cinerariifolium]